MRYLLDTHVWVALELEPERISARVRRQLERSSDELWLSPLSIWEVSLLCDDGRLELRPTLPTWIERALERQPVHDAALVRDVALEARAVTLPHRDPTDRLLAATARTYDLTLVTADQNLLAGTGFQKLAAR